MKKIVLEALVAAFLLIPAIQPPTGFGEGVLPGEMVVENEQPGTGNGGGDEIMPCGDFVDEDEYFREANS